MENTVQLPARPRRDYIDALKGFGIILVVTGHFIEYYRFSGGVFNSIFECIYIFHMPLFCLCSGMVAKFHPGKWLFQQVWLYLLSQTGIFWFRIHVLGEEIASEAQMTEWLLPWRHMWYLYALIFWELTVPMLKLARDKGRLPGAVLAMASALAVGLLGGLRAWPFALDRVFASYPMFACGVLFSPQFDRAAEFGKQRRWLQATALAGFTAVYLLLIRNVYLAPEPIYEGDRIFNAGPYQGNYTARTRMVLYLIGLLTALVLLLALGQNRTLAALGRRTLPVYILHMVLYAYYSHLGIFETAINFGQTTMLAWQILAIGGCVCFFGSPPVNFLFGVIANIWYKLLPNTVKMAVRMLKAGYRRVTKA